MKLELKEHLDKVRHTISEVDRILPSHSYPSDKRTVMVLGLLSTMVENLRTMLQLIKSGGMSGVGGMSGPVGALARDIVRGTRQGLWINSCATKEQMLRIEEGNEFPVSDREMDQAIETAYSKDSFLQNIKKWATQLYKYSRSEIIQLGRWSIDPKPGLPFYDKELREVTTIAILCIVVLAGKFVASQGHSADHKRLETLAGDYAN